MPGIGTLDDAAFLRAFKVIDGVIQRNQPVFVFIWMAPQVRLVAMREKSQRAPHDAVAGPAVAQEFPGAAPSTPLPSRSM